MIPQERTMRFLKENQVPQKKRAKSKKREESEKLPEVSQEMYYDIAVDLKELFGSSKSKSEKNEDIPWDKNDAEDSTPLDHLGSNVESDVAQQSSGFTFSFFGDMEESGVKEGNSRTYIVQFLMSSFFMSGTVE